MAWNGDTLHRKGSSRTLISIERDSTYPNMWRVRRPNGTLSDMVNRTRAKDAAELLVRFQFEGVQDALRGQQHSPNGWPCYLTRLREAPPF